MHTITHPEEEKSRTEQQSFGQALEGKAQRQRGTALKKGLKSLKGAAAAEGDREETVNQQTGRPERRRAARESERSPESHSTNTTTQ